MRHLRIRARSSTGQVEGAARFLHGLAVQTVDGLPKATSPRCPSSGTAEASTDKDSTPFIAGSSLDLWRIASNAPNRSGRGRRDRRQVLRATGQPHGELYLVEMKWHTDRIGVAEISQHLVRLMSRSEARGIFISASAFGDPAVAQTKDFLQHKVCVLCELEELVRLLARGLGVSAAWLSRFSTSLCGPCSARLFVAVAVCM